MSNNNYPFGTPIATADAINTGFPLKNGRYWFVDSSTGSDGASGFTGDTALRTISRAVTLSQAGDIIMVAPGTYAENVTVSKDFITVIGYSKSGYARPDVVPTTGVALTVSAQGFSAKHMRFASNDSDSVIQNGDGYLYEDCVFDGDAGQATTEGNLRLVGDAAGNGTASEGKILNSLFRGSNGAGIIFQHAAAPSGVGVTDVEISGCRFYGNTVDLLSAVNISGGGAGIFLDLSLHGNQFLTTGASYVYADLDQGVSGDLAANSALFTDNMFADEALIASQFDISGQPNVMFVGNYDATGVVDGSAFNN